MTRPVTPDRHMYIRLAIGTLFAVVLGIVTLVWNGDMALTTYMNTLDSGIFGTVSHAVYVLFEPPLAVVWTLLIAAVIWWRTKDYRVGLAFGFTIAGSWLPTIILKFIFQRPRPAVAELSHPTLLAQLAPNDWSFTSGHAAFMTALAAAIMIFWAHSRGRWLGWLGVAIMAVSVLTVGVHYPTDVLGSFVWVATLTPIVAYWAYRAAMRLPALFGHDWDDDDFGKVGSGARHRMTRASHSVDDLVRNVTFRSERGTRSRTRVQMEK